MIEFITIKSYSLVILKFQAWELELKSRVA